MVLLLALRLTVAAGTINGLLFVISANSEIIFKPQFTNVPIVFEFAANYVYSLAELGPRN